MRSLAHLLYRSTLVPMFLGFTLIAHGQGIQQVSGIVPANIDRNHVRILQRIGNQLPLDATMVDQNGKSITFGGILNHRPVLLLAIFYRCTGACSLELENLIEDIVAIKGQRVGRDFDVIVVGIDPKETPELARAKLAMTLATSPNLKGTDAGWHFLTGSMEDIRAITNPLGFYFTFDPDRDIVNHPTGLMFLTPKGVVSSYLLGKTFDPGDIARDLDLARNNQLGIKSPDIFFGCIHIDPLTGKRSIVIQNVLTVLALVTVVALALTLLTLSGKARFLRRRSGAPSNRDEWGFEYPDESDKASP